MAARAKVHSLFDIASVTRGKPSANGLTKPVGYERIVKDGRVQVKCADGRFRYRARVVWEAANGPLRPSDIVHHRNEDPMDDRIENLQKVTRAEHARIHATPERARDMQSLATIAKNRIKL